MLCKSSSSSADGADSNLIECLFVIVSFFLCLYYIYVIRTTVLNNHCVF